MTEKQPNISNQATDAAFEAQRKRRLLEAINRSDEEKFRLFMKMMRIQKMMNNAKIIKP